MKDFLRSVHFKIMLFIIIALFILMLFVSILGVWSSPQSAVLGAVFTPIQKGAAAVSDFVSDFFSAWGERDELRDENQQLQDELSDLREKLVDYDAAKQENLMYKDLLGIKEKSPDLQFEPAKVIARDAGDKFCSFSVDKGSIDGVKLHDPVITSDGVVGYVSKVSLTYSTVRTILDSDTNISVINSRTGSDLGVVTGSIELAADGFCTMTLLPQASGVSVGDLIITTGYGGVFPKDLIIGTVQEVKQSSTDISTTAVIKPSVNIAGLKDVLVITDFEGQGSVVEEDGIGLDSTDNKSGK